MKQVSPIEVYAKERGIELSDAEVQALHNDKAVMGMVARAQTAGLTGHQPVAAAAIPWHQADAIGAIGHHDALDMKGNKVKIRKPPNETPNKFANAAISAGQGNQMSAEAAEAVFGKPRPLVRRTPQERLDEVTKILVDFYKQNGFMPNSILREVQAVYASTGQLDMTVDDLRAIAGYYLTQAMAQGQTNEGVSLPARAS